MSFLRLTLDEPVAHQGDTTTGVDFASVPQLVAAHGLVGAPPPRAR